VRFADVLFRRIAVLIVPALALAACGSEPPTQQAFDDPGLATITVAAEATASARRFQGEVQAVQRAVLAAQTSGRVLELPFDVGEAVQAGDVVLRLTSVEQQSGREQADAALAAAQAQWTDADREQRRMAELGERQLVSRSMQDQATTRRDAAAAALAAARAGLRQTAQQLDYATVRAPFAGIIGQRQVQVGESVGPGQPLLDVLAPSPLRIEVTLSQVDLARLDAAASASVRLPDGRDVVVADVVPGPAIDPATQTGTVRLELGDADLGLRPGDAVAVRFPLGQAQQQRVPTSAVVRRGEVRGVYVISSDQRITLRQVRLGRDDGEHVVVLAGLQDGERIALDPVAALAALKAQREAAAGARHD